METTTYLTSILAYALSFSFNNYITSNWISDALNSFHDTWLLWHGPMVVLHLLLQNISLLLLPWKIYFIFFLPSYCVIYPSNIFRLLTPTQNTRYFLLKFRLNHTLNTYYQVYLLISYIPLSLLINWWNYLKYTSQIRSANLKLITPKVDTNIFIVAPVTILFRYGSN